MLLSLIIFPFVWLNFTQVKSGFLLDSYIIYYTTIFLAE